MLKQLTCIPLWQLQHGFDLMMKHKAHKTPHGKLPSRSTWWNELTFSLPWHSVFGVRVSLLAIQDDYSVAINTCPLCKKIWVSFSICEQIIYSYTSFPHLVWCTIATRRGLFVQSVWWRYAQLIAHSHSFEDYQYDFTYDNGGNSDCQICSTQSISFEGTGTAHST